MTTSTADATRTTGPALPRARVNIIFGTIMLGMLLAALDQTIVSTALPTIVADLGGAGHLSWVVTAYLLAQTVSVGLAGKFGDLFGRKLVFQLSAGVFVVGSMLCGLATSMSWLITCRAVQGIGGGGLTVTATALIGDVIPLRERGRYQGALGAVFGVTTVIGPLLGGLFTDHLSWRWAFYVNVPVAVVVIVAAVFTIPSVTAAVRPVVDYLGILLLALGSVGLTLAATFGGTSYSWGSPVIVGLFVGSVLVLVGFVLVQRRAAEPTLPMRLFASPVFSVSVVLSFIVGFAMLGSLTFLPTYLQFVTGVSATDSGVRMLPMVVGLLVASTTAGSYVGRSGRYKIFPVTGTLVLAVGMFLLSLMDQHTPYWQTALFVLVLGVGIGLSMQVLTLVVQNTSDYRDLGVATSGVTYFRTIGGSFGAAIFGSVYASQLAPRLAAALAGLHGVAPAAAASPETLRRLPEPAHSVLAGAYAQALQDVFRYAVPVALAGFVLALFLRQVPMRGTVRPAATDMGDGFAMPTPPSSAEELERAVGRVLRRDGRAAIPGILADSGTGLDAGEAWCLSQVAVRGAVAGNVTLADIARQHRLPAGVLRPAFSAMVDRGYMSGVDGDMTLTARGQQTFGALVNAWRRWLTHQFAEWRPEQDHQLDALLHRWARQAVQQERVPAVTGGADPA